MRKPKLSLNFRIYSDPNLSVIANSVAFAMTDNLDFKDPIPMLPAFKTAVANYVQALTDAGNGGNNAVDAKNMAREILEQECVRLAMYAMYIANGSSSVLIGTAFPLCRQPKTATVGIPDCPSLKSGFNSGEVICKVKLVKGTYSYQFNVCSEQPTQATLWKTIPSPRGKVTFKNLVLGQKYWFQVVAVGGHEQRVNSPVSYIYVQ